MATFKTAFLSSTAKDLAAYREAAYRAISGMDGWHCVRMEDFGARDYQADDFCRAKVTECDVLVGIVGHLHGSCPPGSEQSYTEREYDFAVAADKPRLMFIAPEDFSLPANLIEPATKRRKQQAFRKRVNTELIRDTFTSPTDLGRRVVQAIRNWEQEQPTQEQPTAARAEGVMPLPPQPYLAHPYALQEHFTGRVRERQLLTEWLRDDKRPMLALIAIGGMGKSALTWAWLQRDLLGLPLPGQPEDEPAAAACRVPEEARPEGVLWWSFYEREAGCAAFLNAALTYASGGQVDPKTIDSDYDKLQRLIALLQQRRLLLVLDGLERQLRAYASLSAAYQGDAVPGDVQGDPNSCTDPHAADFLRQVAALSQGSRVLITSRLFPRELDGVAGCRREELTGLDLADAVTFFRAQGVKNPTRAEVQDACAPYGYLPLALRLLAGVIVRDTRMPGDIQVARRHPVLAKLKGKEQHHILEVSYDALDEEKRELLSRIAAFRSPMTYEAVSVLNPYADDEQFDAALDELIDRGLLFFDRERGRYDLHPIVRQHAYDRLADKEGVHSRLRDYFAAVPAPDKVQSLDDLAPVIELYHHTVGAGRCDEALYLFRDRLDKPLFYGFGAYQTTIELLSALFPGGDGRPRRLRKDSDQAWTLNALANCYSASGQPRSSVRAVEEGLALAQDNFYERENVATGLENLAIEQIALGEFAAAEANIRRADVLTSQVVLERMAFDMLAAAGATVVGDFSPGDQTSYVADLSTGDVELGLLLAYRGAFADSRRHLTAAQKALDALGPQRTNFVSEVRCYRSQRALLMGEAKAALRAAQSARELADISYPGYGKVERDIIQSEWLLGAALVALAAERKKGTAKILAEAEVHLTEALTRCRRINLVEFEPDILLAWARWHHARGNAQEARERADEALAIADRCEYRLKQADIHNFLARLALDAGDKTVARQQTQIAHERAWCDGPPHCYKPALDEADRLLAEAEGLP